MEHLGKKIVILNGSPRPNGNTSCLIDAFSEGAQAAGHVLTRFDLRSMNIHPCIGCMKGGRHPSGPCVQNDDMNLIYPVFTEADVVVLASPLYYWTVSGLLKMAFDRLYAVVEANDHTIPVKDCILLMSAGNPKSEVYATCIAFHEAFMRRMGWKDVGRVLATDVMMPGDIRNTPWLEQAHLLGSSL